MNYLLFFYGFFAFVLIQVNARPDARLQKLAEGRAKCLAKNGLTKDDILQTKSLAFLDNPKSKCYTGCLAETLHVFKEDNSYDLEKIFSYLSDELLAYARPIIIKCSQAPGNISDRCEKAYLSLKCVREENENMYTHLGVFEPVA